MKRPFGLLLAVSCFMFACSALAYSAVTLETYGGSGSTQNTTGSISSSSTTLSLAAAKDFANGEFIRVNGAGAATGINSITGLTVTPSPAGSTTYYVAVAAMDAAGGLTAAVVQNISNGPVINYTNGNYLAIQIQPATTGTTPSGFAIWVSVGGSSSYNLVAIMVNNGASTQTFNYGISVVQYGISGVSNNPDSVSSTPPTSAQADWLIAKISSGGGTTTLTLATAASTTVSGSYATHDDTQPCQQAVSAAMTGSSPLTLGQKNYQLTGNCGSITSHLEIAGVGFQGTDSNYALGGGGADYITSCANASCLLELGVFSTVLTAATDDSVYFHNFEILYPSFGAPYSGATGIAISSHSTTTDSYNSQSIIRDVLIVQADRCLSIVNGQSFNFSDNVLYNCVTFGTLVTSTVSGQNASVGDWEYIGNTMESGLQAMVAWLEIQTWGGGRVTANKFNTCGNGQNGEQCTAIDINPTRNITGGSNTEPMVIAGNSIEGCYYCIRFYGGNSGNTGSSTLGVITGNQMWGITDIYSTTGNSNSCGTGCWLDGWTITGNVFNINGGSGTAILQLSGMKDLAITGNVFNANSGGVTAFNPGTDISNVNIQSNIYTSSIATKANGCGSNNIVCGGSSD